MKLFVKAAVEALKEFPAVNASIDDSDPKKPAIVYKRYYNVGVAVSTKRGLMVPVLRNADQLSFFEVENGIGELAARGGTEIDHGRLQRRHVHHLQWWCVRSLMSTPILNPPRVAILGMHTIQQRPVAVDGKVEIRPMMYLAVSYDHRIIDVVKRSSFLVQSAGWWKTPSAPARDLSSPASGVTGADEADSVDGVFEVRLEDGVRADRGAAQQPEPVGDVLFIQHVLLVHLYRAGVEPSRADEAATAPA